jgi:6,7-dimethyl-8-ribityllumazine synthase
MLEHTSNKLTISHDHLTGTREGAGLKVAIVVAEFNTEITQGLLDGSIKGLKLCGLSDVDITILTVPGVVECSSVAAKLASKGHFDAIICLGAVIRGDTSHFDFVCQSVTQGITSVSVEYKLPVIFGVLTTDTYEQAKIRASDDDNNKGLEAAYTAIEMATLFKNLDG